MANPSTPAKPLWLSSVMAIALFLGPCLWLYARSISDPVPPRLRDLPRSHFIPLAIGLLLLLPLVERTHTGTEFAVPGRVPDPTHALWVHGTMLACVALFAVQAGYYLRASLRILKKHAGVAKALLSDLDDRELNTLRLLIFVVGAHWVVGIARALHGWILGKEAGYFELFAISEVMIALWAMISLMRSAVPVDAGDRRLANEIAASKYTKSALDEPTRTRIVRKLAGAWDDKLHLDSRLTLRLLCERLRENPHYVSQVINQDLGTSFYDLVGRRRVFDAMEKLIGQPERPILEIALEVGFNSKSTFNAAFRQHTGTTPSSYRETRTRSPGCTTSGPAG
jgi:AraC-like DNA-binding protein